MDRQRPLVVRGLTKDFVRRRGLFARPSKLRAVDDVSFEIARGETLALVGESGCGKTTVARLVLGILKPTRGSVKLAGQETVGSTGSSRRAQTRRIQMVFQDPAGSLDPRWRVARSIAEPLRCHGSGRRREIGGQVDELLDRVSIDPPMGSRFPHEFSGGQRQRIALARAMAIGPDVIVADEPTSALDVSLRLQILDLFASLQQERGISFLLVSHDLALVRHASQRVAVMHRGRLVEQGPTESVLDRPRHPYTDRLLRSIPSVDPKARRILKDGSPAKGLELITPTTSGCLFAHQCSRAEEDCRRDPPPELRTVESATSTVDSGHRVACHHPL